MEVEHGYWNLEWIRIQENAETKSQGKETLHFPPLWALTAKFARDFSVTGLSIGIVKSKGPGVMQNAHAYACLR